MKRNDDNGRFLLQNHLRTWSELKRQKAAEELESGQAQYAHSLPEEGSGGDESSYSREKVGWLCGRLRTSQ